MTDGWLREAVDELCRRGGSSEKAIQLIEAGLRNSDGIARAGADPTEDELMDASALIEVLTSTKWPPSLRARALLAADVLEMEVAWRARAAAIAEQRAATQRAAAAKKHAEEAAATAKKRAEEAAATARKRAEDAAAAATAERISGLAALGVPKRRIDALIALTQAGPYDVVCQGVRKEFDESGLVPNLQALGYRQAEAKRVLLRALHIAEPQMLAYLLDEGDAIGLKVRFEEAGAKIKIKRHTGDGKPTP